jgi:hypothetical protein
MLHLDLYLPTEPDNVRKYWKENDVKIFTTYTSAKITNEQENKHVCICTGLEKTMKVYLSPHKNHTKDKCDFNP